MNFDPVRAPLQCRRPRRGLRTPSSTSYCGGARSYPYRTCHGAPYQCPSTWSDTRYRCLVPPLPSLTTCPCAYRTAGTIREINSRDLGIRAAAQRDRVKPGNTLQHRLQEFDGSSVAQIVAHLRYRRGLSDFQGLAACEAETRRSFRTWLLYERAIQHRDGRVASMYCEC